MQTCSIKCDCCGVRYIQALRIVIDIDANQRIAMITAEAAQPASLCAKDYGQMFMGAQAANVGVAVAIKARNKKSMIPYLFDCSG